MEMKDISLPRFSSRSVRKLAERAMVSGLNPGEARRLDRMLRNNRDDMKAYGRLARLFRAMEGDPPLGAPQQQRILEGVLAQVLPGSSERHAGRAPGWLTRSAPALAVLILVSVCGLLLGLGEINRDQFQPRGHGLSATGATDARAFLRPFCIREDVVVKTPPLVSPLTPDARCLQSDKLQLMITHRAGYPYLLVFGQLKSSGRQDKLLWYYPVPPTGESGAAPMGADYSPLGQAIHLEVNHQPGDVRLLAVFSKEPLSAEVMFQWMKGLGRRDSAASLLKKVAGDRDLLVLEQWVEIKGDARP